jgi:hypothetical protein
VVVISSGRHENAAPAIAAATIAKRAPSAMLLFMLSISRRIRKGMVLALTLERALGVALIRLNLL